MLNNTNSTPSNVSHSMLHVIGLSSIALLASAVTIVGMYPVGLIVLIMMLVLNGKISRYAEQMKTTHFRISTYVKALSGYFIVTGLIVFVSLFLGIILEKKGIVVNHSGFTIFIMLLQLGMYLLTAAVSAISTILYLIIYVDLRQTKSN